MAVCGFVSAFSSSEPVTFAGTVKDALGASAPPSEIQLLLPSCDTSRVNVESTVRLDMVKVTVSSVQAMVDLSTSATGQNLPVSAHRENTMPSTPGSVFSGQIADNST